MMNQFYVILFIQFILLLSQNSHANECTSYFQRLDQLNVVTRTVHKDVHDFLSVQIHVFNSKLRQLEKIDTSNVSPEYVMEFRDFLETAVHLFRKKRLELESLSEFSSKGIHDYMVSMRSFSNLSIYKNSFQWTYGRELKENFLLRNQMRALEGLYLTFLKQPHIKEFYKLMDFEKDPSVFQ